MKTERSARRLDRTAAVCAAIFLVVSAPPVYGNGVIVSQTSESVIKASRTIVAPTASGTYQMTEIDFERPTGGPAFVWILPVPAQDEEVTVATCSSEHFDELATLGQPRILLRRRTSDEGCGGESIPRPVVSLIDAHAYSKNKVTSTPRTHTPFESIDELEEWLQDQNTSYVLNPSNKAVLSHYVASTYHFVAVEVTDSLTTGKICLELDFTPPPQREYDYLLPMKSGAVSTGSPEDPVDTEILIYALADGTVRPLVKRDGGAVYKAVTINPSAIVATGATTTDYDAIFDEAVGSPPGFVIEFSGALDQPLEWTRSDATWLTRLRTRMTPSELTGPDLALQADEPEDVPRDYSIVVARASGSPDASVAICAVALVGALAFRRRKRSP